MGDELREVTMDDVLQSVQELTTYLRENKGEATVDWERVKVLFEGEIREMVQIQVTEQMAKQPVRGTPVGPYVAGRADVQGLLKNNRYARNVRHMLVDGYARDGGQIIKPVDLCLAQVMLDAQMRAKMLGHRADGDEHAANPSDDLTRAIKALTSTGTGTGDEVVPEDLAATLWEDVHLASQISGLMVNVPMPTDPFNVPLGLGDPTWRKGTETISTTVSNLSTAKSTLTSTEQVTEQTWSYTLTEDAAIAMAPAMRAALARSGAEQIDYFAINADATSAATGNINSDDAAPADDASFLSDGQDGLRHQWLVDNTNMSINAGGDALADADILNVMSAMGKYAVDPNRCSIVTDIWTYLKNFLDLDNVIGIDKFGPNTPIISGQLAAYRGFPIVISASHGKAEADGKISATAASNTLGSATFWNRDMWYMGFRRQVLVEADRDIRRRMYILVTSFREAVGAHGTRSSNTHTGGIRNILL